ncbi:MAG TPA: hypothetical protein VK569_01730, partial [Bacteroidota bacterium]|nr:hypothetical protein [Bacteroidota bacterium]
YTADGLRTAVVNIGGLYAPFLKRFVSLLEGERAGDGLAGPLEAVRVHLAARISLQSGDRVPLRGLPAGAGFDGKAFAAEYAAGKRRQAQDAGKVR